MRGSLGDKFAYLDNEEIESSLLDFNDGDLKKIKFYIPQIHCSSCIWLLENMYRMRDGIVQSQVNFIKKEAYVTYRSDQVSLRELVELMTSIGYEPAISLQSGTKEAKKKGYLMILSVISENDTGQNTLNYLLFGLLLVWQ